MAESNILNISFVDEDLRNSDDDAIMCENDNADKRVDNTTKRETYSCTECNYSSTSRGNFYRHKRSIHRQKRYQCKDCTQTFLQNYDLKQHFKSKHENTKSLCEICSKEYNSRSSLRRHRSKDHTDECKYECATCNTSFVERNHYLGHLDTHLNAKPHACQVCNKRFAFKSSCQRHALGCGKHTKNYTCDICGNALKNQRSLKAHIEGVHGKKDKICRCGMAFSWTSALSRHQKRCAFK